MEHPRVTRIRQYQPLAASRQQRLDNQRLWVCCNGIANRRGIAAPQQSRQRRKSAITVATSTLMSGLVAATIPANLGAPTSSAMRHRRTTYVQPKYNLLVRCVTFSGLYGQRSHQVYALVNRTPLESPGSLLCDPHSNTATNSTLKSLFLKSIGFELLGCLSLQWLGLRTSSAVSRTKNK